MNDIDNAREDVPYETPEHVAEVLASHDLKAAFFYETFGSTADHMRFRFVIVASEEIADKAQRDRIQAAIIALFPQSDVGCVNADRIFFGTDKGLIDAYTDFDAVCSKADLLRLADAIPTPKQPKAAESVRTAKNP
jgi:hypothetical protein